MQIDGEIPLMNGQEGMLSTILSKFQKDTVEIILIEFTLLIVEMNN